MGHKGIPGMGALRGWGRYGRAVRGRGRVVAAASWLRSALRAPLPAGRRHHGAAPQRRSLGPVHLLPHLQGRAVALRVGRQPRLVPLHLRPRPPAAGAVPPPRRRPRPRFLLPAVLSPAE
uniref:Uncharacterized protein n=1 Tax=Pavo cristatus TaxID=9049 RepID=A0A8C9FTD2_PAVCR